MYIVYNIFIYSIIKNSKLAIEIDENGHKSYINNK